MPETDDKDARRGTFALFAASAVLAAVGVSLLYGTSSGMPSSATGTPAPAPTALSPSPSTASAASPAPRTPPPTSSAPSAAAAPLPVTKPMQDAARAFVVAWASHDARPGGDSSYDDASHRAAAYAAGDLATDLRTRRSGSAGVRQWLEWKDSRVRVTASVLRVSLPDGAPALTEDSGYAQVLYAVTQKPAAGPPATSQEHVVLKLRRDGDGTWRVSGLPNV
ncbi:hypothetical protein ABZ896_22895 [Streptomyces sp. NPDC047072]|uniref:hypothetical protein n=1 Tax=Streptomyces sp. NPDC047072 TaxID=3154809 RepID=UPI0033EACD6C